MNLPIRKSTRLRGYNYSASGAYFITVCTKDRKQLFGQIVGCGDFDAPKMSLSDYGEILNKHLIRMGNRYSYIKIDNYVIMPNHFHMILRIADDKNGASETAAPYNHETSRFISLLKRYCNREYGKNVFQTSFYDHIIRGEEDYKKVWEYIENNVLQWELDHLYDRERSQ